MYYMRSFTSALESAIIVNTYAEKNRYAGGIKEEIPHTFMFRLLTERFILDGFAMFGNFYLVTRVGVS